MRGNIYKKRNKKSCFKKKVMFGVLSIGSILAYEKVSYADNLSLKDTVKSQQEQINTLIKEVESLKIQLSVSQEKLQSTRAISEGEDKIVIDNQNGVITLKNKQNEVILNANGIKAGDVELYSTGIHAGGLL